MSLLPGLDDVLLGLGIFVPYGLLLWWFMWRPLMRDLDHRDDD